MKNKLSPFLTLILALAIALTGIAAAPAPVASTQAIDCPICNPDLSGYTGSLSSEEIHGLLLALNDEYHAYAVYGQVVSDFGANAPFANIQNSEQGHINMLINLFNLYDVPVPANPWIGQAPSFPSLTDACAAGVEAEIANRDLYTNLFQTTSRVEIVNVYESLQRASDQRHLPIFQACASGTTRQGIGMGQGGARRGGNGQGNNGQTWNNGPANSQPGNLPANGNPGNGVVPQSAQGQGNAPWWVGIYNWFFGH